MDILLRAEMPSIHQLPMKKHRDFFGRLLVWHAIQSLSLCWALLCTFVNGDGSAGCFKKKMGFSLFYLYLAEDVAGLFEGFLGLIVGVLFDRTFCCEL